MGILLQYFTLIKIIFSSDVVFIQTQQTTFRSSDCRTACVLWRVKTILRGEGVEWRELYTAQLLLSNVTCIDQ